MKKYFSTLKEAHEAAKERIRQGYLKGQPATWSANEIFKVPKGARAGQYMVCSYEEFSMKYK